jgi:hypothetical protein
MSKTLEPCPNFIGGEWLQLKIAAFATRGAGCQKREIA